jgi:hypothetical protein
MSTLGDAEDVNPVAKFLPHDLPHLRQRIVEAVAAIDHQMLQRVWQELITGLTSAASLRV